MPSPDAQPRRWPVRPRAGGTVLHVLVQPRASRAGVVGLHGDVLKLRVCGAPVDGRANDELRHVLARALDLAPGGVTILRGHTGRRKQVLLAGLSPADVARRLGWE